MALPSLQALFHFWPAIERSRYGRDLFLQEDKPPH